MRNEGRETDAQAIVDSVVARMADLSYAGALEVILDGGNRKMKTGAMEAVGEVGGAGSVAASDTRLLEADCTVHDGGDGTVNGSAAGGGQRISVESLLLKPVRYFTDGAVIGSKAFVEGLFEANRVHFSKTRTHVSQPFRNPEDIPKRGKTGLHSLKDLRLWVYYE